VGQTIVLRGLPRARGARNRCGALARRLKAGCSQDWLPHTAAEPQPKEPVLRTVGRRIACPTKIAAAREELRLL
jgi:hypothetical protein